MLFKKLCLLAFVAFYAQSGFAFTIINQTDSEKILKLEEAYRPAPDQSGNLKMPVSLGHAPHECRVAPHSMYVFDLVEPCSVLLVSVINTVVEDGIEKKTTSLTCYEPYEYQDFSGCLTCEYFNELLLTDSWGIVLHKPIIGEKTSYGLDYGKRFSRAQAIKQGYGIKCLDPKLLERVTSLEELPDELKE